jgi:hypothetical protein
MNVLNVRSRGVDGNPLPMMVHVSPLFAEPTRVPFGYAAAVVLKLAAYVPVARAVAPRRVKAYVVPAVKDRGLGEHRRIERRGRAGESPKRRRGQYGRGREATAGRPHLDNDVGVRAGAQETEQADVEPREHTTDARREGLAHPCDTVEQAAAAAAVELLLIDLLSGDRDAV